MATEAEQLELDAGGRVVAISNPGKVMFPEHGETKADLARYYLAVAEPLMRTVRDRPTLLQRFPNGATGQSFFQKRIPQTAPEWLQTTTVSTPNGTTSRAIVMADIAHVVWAANQGCLGFHPWPYRASAPDETDELRLDLDPSPGVTFEMVREAASEVRAFIGELGIVAFPKTTGNRGLHLYVRVEPGRDSIAVRQAAVSVAREMERRRPDLITGAWWKEERGARVFIDFNQNAPHKTVFGAWCVRARVGAQVSTPFAWDELAAIVPDELSIRTVPGRLEDLGDPWAAIDDAPQVDRAAPRALPRRPRRGHPRQPLAARLPEDARRGAEGRPEPGPEAPRHRRLTAGARGRAAVAQDAWATLQRSSVRARKSSAVFASGEKVMSSSISDAPTARTAAMSSPICSSVPV